MSSRRSKKSASNRYPTRWSEWVWSDQHNCYVRYREKGNDYEWEYKVGPVLAEPEGPMTESTESAYLDPSGEQPQRKQDSRDTSHLDYPDDAKPPDDTQGRAYDTQDTLQQGEHSENGMADITNGLSQTILSSEPDQYPSDYYSQDQYPQGYSPYPPSFSQPVYPQQPYERSRENRMKTIRASDSHNKHKALEYRYKTHKGSEFQTGRVFELPWDEPNYNNTPNGSMLDSDDDITESENLGWSSRIVHAKVRKFVVVDSRKFEGHSICLPIKTYGYRGLTKHGVHPEVHAVIYSSERQGPFYLPDERDQGLMTLEPIRVELSQTHFRVDERSRLNYASPYTVDHNVKVCFIGRVAKHFERQLIEDFNRINAHDESNSISKRDMNQSDDETSGGYPNQGRGGLSEIYLPKNGAGYVQVTTERGQQFRDYGGQYKDEYGSDGVTYE